MYMGYLWILYVKIQDIVLIPGQVKIEVGLVTFESHLFSLVRMYRCISSIKHTINKLLAMGKWFSIGQVNLDLHLPERLPTFYLKQ